MCRSQAKLKHWTLRGTPFSPAVSKAPQKMLIVCIDRYHIVILTNQSRVSLKDNSKALQKDTASLANFKSQVTAVLRQLNIHINIYAATEHDVYRKPRVGMWKELIEDLDLATEQEIDLTKSFFVGDAAGREAADGRSRDHSCVDRWASLHLCVMELS